MLFLSPAKKINDLHMMLDVSSDFAIDINFFYLFSFFFFFF